MDKGLVYAILASSLIHGMVILLWPRMTQPGIGEYGNMAGVVNVEYLPSFESNTKVGTAKTDSNPQKREVDKGKTDSDLLEREKDPDKNNMTGKMITDHLLEDLGHRRRKNTSIQDFSIPHVRLPKQFIMPDEEEYAMLWPEEFTESNQKDTQTFLHPDSEKRHKEVFTGLNNTDISGPLMRDEFPEEMPSQESSDIIWKGTPRTWITKPESPPNYKGDEEGLVKLRFWVNKNGEVVNAIPIQKLSAELEEKALAYIFSWRFEPSMSIPLQEGVIRINFKLD